MKLWGGRFNPDERDARFETFSESFSVDHRLVHYDIAVNRAYLKLLSDVGVIAPGEARRLGRGLESLDKAVHTDVGWNAGQSAEDVHTWVEASLEKEVGPVARKLRTGRSRNDLVATTTRLWVKTEIGALQSAVLGLMQALVVQARQHANVILPGYTHLQPAQPILFGHYLLAYFEMMSRNWDRLRDCFRRADELPLGAGALAGTAFPIDRVKLARMLGFARVSRNSLDATSDRDFVAELLFACALIMVHLSRLAEDLIIYSSPGFGYVELGDGYSTGSSIMPQKKNPDSLELIRGKAAGLIGKVTGVLTLIKGLPLAYDRDLQEDKAALFEGVDTTRESLAIAAAVIGTLRVNADRMRAATAQGFLTATEIADGLVARGVPFGDAHEQVGKLVRFCADSGRTFMQISEDEARRFIPSWDADLRDLAVSPERAVRRKDVIGGTAPKQVARQMRAAERRLARLKRT
jgi:argininosuccinate lyase